MALRIGLIGCGSIARAHWRGYEAAKERVRVAALADVSPENRAWFKERAPAAAEYDSFEQLIQQADLDAVDICLPHHLHHPCILASIEKGLHWLCEKPLAISVDQAREIETAMEGARLVGMSAHNQVFFPSLLEARRLLDEGQLGEVYTVICEDCFIMGLPPAGALPGQKSWTAVAKGSWRWDLDTMGGGELIDTGYHPSYRLLFLARSEPVKVAAVTGLYRNKQMQAEDTATMVVAFENGVTGLVRTSWAMETPYGHSMFHVVCERGELFGNATELSWKPARFGEPARKTFAAVDCFEAEINHFITCIEEGTEPVQSHKDGIQVLKMILRGYEFASKTG